MEFFNSIELIVLQGNGCGFGILYVCCSSILLRPNIYTSSAPLIFLYIMWIGVLQSSILRAPPAVSPTRPPGTPFFIRTTLGCSNAMWVADVEWCQTETHGRAEREIKVSAKRAAVADE
jgi:hypothetical protein